MKKNIFIILLCVLLTSCSKQFIQVFDTSSTNIKLKGDNFVYETDTLKITYAFWASNGVMQIAIYNKLEKPIYIDWKNSSFICNDNKLNYWIEETQTDTKSYYGGYFYNGPLLKPGFTINAGIQNSSSTTFKPERVTFIPPKSNYYRSSFYLLPGDFLDFHYNDTIVPRNDKPSKKTTIYYANFSYQNSPLRFRNYLAFSFSENAQQFYFIDNEFYLNSIKEMDYRHFLGEHIYDYKQNVNLYGKSPFEKETSFYIKIAKEISIEINKNRNKSTIF